MAILEKDRYEIEPYADIVDVWVLDSSFNKLGLIDDYTSLIWSRRYWEVGDFELYVQATPDNIALLDVDLTSDTRFIMRADNMEVMKIEKIEISVDAEEGDFITVSGRDLRCLLYQRCNDEERSWGEEIISPVVGDIPSNAQTVGIPYVIHQLVNLNAYSPSDSKRVIPYLSVSTEPEIDGAETTAITIDAGVNVGEKIEELCTDFRFGWKCVWDPQARKIYFRTYEGADRSSLVIFSEEFCNLRNMTSTDDLEEFYNTMILINQYTDEDGNELPPDVVTFGEYSGFNRFEKAFNGSEDLDVSDITKLRELLYTYKLPRSYNVIYQKMTEHDPPGSDDSPSYTFEDMGSDEPNPNDENRTGNDYMSDNPLICITAYNASDGFAWEGDKWEISVQFISYDFYIYSDEWLDYLKEISGNCGTVITGSNGLRYYRVSRSNDPNQILQIGTGVIKDYYWPWEKDKGTFDNWWALTIPAEYSDDGKEHIIKVDTSDTYWDSHVYEWHNVPFSFDVTLSEIFMRDRYMAKAYSMVEEPMPTLSYEGEVIPFMQFRYRKDYDVGDQVMLKTDIGIKRKVRVIEAVETFDRDGYNVDVKFAN